MDDYILYYTPILPPPHVAYREAITFCVTTTQLLYYSTTLLSSTTILPPPQVAYREAITKSAEIDYTHKKQSGGSGQYAKIKARWYSSSAVES